MPELGSIGGSMNTIGLSAYTNLGSVNRATLEGASSSSAARTSSEPARRPESSDRVELSEHARFMERLRSMPAVRADKVADIKSQIEAGTYETDEKISIAFERMLDEIDLLND